MKRYPKKQTRRGQDHQSGITCDDAMAASLGRAVLAAFRQQGTVVIVVDHQHAPAQAPSTTGRGRKLDMSCRAPKCKARSKGPRFHYLCEKHLAQRKS